MTAPADEAAQVRQIWSALGLPGVIDVHTHFMPKPVLDKVWRYFDSAGPLVGRPWPIRYRINESRRLQTLRQFGVRRFTALVYPHKSQMAAWLNQWAAQFARYTPDCLATATFYPEPGAADYVEKAICGGVRIFKAHVQVGRYNPNDPLLDRVWGLIEDAGTPVVIHCGSGPAPGEHTGPEPIDRLLRRYPRLRLIIAHMGMPEYAEFLDICEHYPGSGWIPRWPSPHSPKKPCRFHNRSYIGCRSWAIASCSAATSRTSPTATRKRCGRSPRFPASTTTGCAACSTRMPRHCSTVIYLDPNGRQSPG